MVILKEKKQLLFSDDEEEKKAIIQEFVDTITITYDDETDEFDLALKVRVIAGGGEATPAITLTEELLVSV